MELPYLFWPTLAALVSTIYFFLIKYYVLNPEPLILITVILLELLVIFLYYKSLVDRRSGPMYAVINGLSVIIGLLIAVTFFKEDVTAIDVLV
jgi:multidrug transporter EmrE-like cation transporter